MKPFIPTEKDRRAIATLVDTSFKVGAVRDEETSKFLSNLKERALRGLPPVPPPKRPEGR